MGTTRKQSPPGAGHGVASRLEWLVRQGISQRGLDRLAGQPEGHLGVILHRYARNADVEVSEKTIVAYAAALGVSTDWLTLGAGDAPDVDTVRARVEGKAA